MCRGDDPSCSEFELHHRQFVEDMARERRAFLASRFAAKGGVGDAGGRRSCAAQRDLAGGPASSSAGQRRHGSLGLLQQEPANRSSRSTSGDFVTIETLTHQASDDHERMIEGDPGAESVYLWTKDRKGVRVAAPARATARGWASISAPAPCWCRAREPGDVLEVRIVDVTLRPSANPEVQGLRLRQQRRRQLGLPLQRLSRPARRARS